MFLAAEGVRNGEIAELTGFSRPKVNLCRGRYQDKGLVGLGDVKRPGRPRTIDPAAIVTATLTPPPKKLGVARLGEVWRLGDGVVVEVLR